MSPMARWEGICAKSVNRFHDSPVWVQLWSIDESPVEVFDTYIIRAMNIPASPSIP
jgi:hypothetical protein